jgi:ankyrin repeat protein
MEELLALQNKQRICRLAASTGDTQLLKAVASATPLNKVLDHKRLTLLHVASRDGQADVVKLLLDTVVPGDPDFLEAMDNDQLTAMDHAVEQRHDAIAELLMDRGGGLEGGWLKDRLVEAVTSGEVKELQRLMWFAKDISVAVRSTDQDGRSLGHIAMQHKGAPRNELLEMLLAFGADLNEVDFYGNDAVSVAVASADSDPELEAILAKSAASAAAQPNSPFLRDLRSASPTGGEPGVPPLSLETSA